MADENRGRRAGYIIPIGGSEDKDKNPVILERFISLCGGPDARVVIIPTASRLAETAPQYRALFGRLGASSVEIMSIQRRGECDKPEHLTLLDRVTGVFITGGDQMRLATVIGGTRLSARLLARNREGMHVAGTSAGASFMSEHMIAGGKTGQTPRSDIVKMAGGLGLHNRLIIDQHFRQRHRLGRLITAAAFNPSAIGLGVDENTAAFIGPLNRLEVAGSGWVTIVDPSATELSGIDSGASRRRLSISDLRIHMLLSGDEYDIDRREAVLNQDAGCADRGKT